MSTIKVSNVNPPTAGAGVKIDGLQMPTAGALSGRRININGAMQVAQRGTSYSLAHDDASLTVYATCDRYQFVLSNFDSYDCTITQSSDAPDGFANSLKVETGTAEAAVDADELFYVQHKIEGQDVQMLQNGSSSAKKVTLSFYVKTSQAGTYGVVLYKNDNTARVISATYTTTTTDWEFVELTFAGDTAGGGIDDDNGEGFRIAWTLAAGSDWTGTDTSSWTNYATTEWTYNHAQNGLATTASATWQLSGVQLELGDKATPFEHRSYGDELARCQRYYYKWIPNTGNDVVCDANVWATDSALGQFYFPQIMRVEPDLSVSDVADFVYSANSVDRQIASITKNRATTNAIQMYVAGSATLGSWGFTSGVGGFLRDDGTQLARVELNSEL